MQTASESTDYKLLVDYLYTVHHAHAADLADVDLLLLAKDSFRQFVVFLGDKFALSNWYRLFTSYVQDLNRWLGGLDYHADWVLFSWELDQYIRASGVTFS